LGGQVVAVGTTVVASQNNHSKRLTAFLDELHKNKPLAVSGHGIRRPQQIVEGKTRLSVR
jgi:hypothetical protein